MTDRLFAVDTTAFEALIAQGGRDALDLLFGSGSRIVVSDLVEREMMDGASAAVFQGWLDDNTSADKRSSRIVKIDVAMPQNYLESYLPFDVPSDATVVLPEGAARASLLWIAENARTVLVPQLSEYVANTSTTEFVILADDAGFFDFLLGYFSDFSDAQLAAANLAGAPYSGTAEFMNDLLRAGRLSKEAYNAYRDYHEEIGFLSDFGKAAFYNASEVERFNFNELVELGVASYADAGGSVQATEDGFAIISGGRTALALRTVREAGVLKDPIGFEASINAAYLAFDADQRDKLNELVAKVVLTQVVIQGIKWGAAKYGMKLLKGYVPDEFFNQSSKIMRRFIKELVEQDAREFSPIIAEYMYKIGKPLFDGALNRIWDKLEVSIDTTAIKDGFYQAISEIHGFAVTVDEMSPGDDFGTFSKWSEARGGEGNDFLLGLFPEFLPAGSKVDPDDPDSAETTTDRRLILDGGAGDDWVVTVFGEKAITIGGEGRDWIFNTSSGGILIGDTVDGLTADGEDINATVRSDRYGEVAKNTADVFWFFPETVILDPGHNDTLSFFGYPLVGGSNEIPGMGVLGGGLLQATNIYTFLSPLYFDAFFPFLTYYEKDGSLFVLNVFDEFMGITNPTNNFESLKGVMEIKNFEGPAYRPIFGATYAAFWDDEKYADWLVGDLGMLFKRANPLIALYSLLPMPGLGGLNRVAPIIDYAYTKLAFVRQLVKKADWLSDLDPLVLDLDGDGIETISIAEADVYFDMDGDYFAERTGWLDGDDGFLALDRNRNGLIDDINELFGDVGVSGFAELAQYDDNGDGVIDAADLIYADLKVWQDIDRDGQSDEGELTSLADMGIVSIDLATDALDAVTPQGALLRERSGFTWDTGEVGNVFEAIFDVNDVDTKFRGETGIAEWLIGSEAINSKGFGTITDLGVSVSNDFHLQDIVAAASAAMVTPNLKELRALAGEALGQWGYALDLTRELAPVLLDRTNGQAARVDYGVWVEDEIGGYWVLNSGDPIMGVDGQPIVRATLEDIMAMPVAGQRGWQLEQMFSPLTRAMALEHREAAPYLVEIVDGRAVVLDYGIQNADGSWRLASGAAVTDASGTALAAPTRADVVAMQTAADQSWRVEDIGFNPYAAIDVAHVGVKLVDGIAVDYTVEVTDANGSFYVWARNLDRALELQEKFGTPREFVLRNFEIDFETLDEVGSTDDSTVRVELLTPGQFHFALSLIGVEFNPRMLSATIADQTGAIDYSVNDTDRASLVEGEYVSPIDVMIELLDEVMEQYTIVSRAFAVRMALQGGLKDFARGIAYDIETDSYAATTNAELAPMFEAIFEAIPAGFDAGYDYLVGWSEILSQVYPDYRVNGDGNTFGASVAVDQKYIFQMMIPAFEKNPSDVDLAAAMNALALDETRLVAHATDAAEVDGTRGGDFIYITGGDQVYRGGIGSDTYFVGAGFGTDEIHDIDFGDADEIRFTDITSDEVSATRIGEDLILSVAGRDDVLTVRDHFLGELNPGFGNTVQDSAMKLIVFADGVAWDTFRIAFEVADPQDTDDVIIGSGSLDVMWGGKGNDVLRGGAGGDLYVYFRGDGQDVIGDSNLGSVGLKKTGLDFLQFRGDISESDLMLRRDGESDDLQVYLLDADGALTDDRIYIEDMFDGLRLNLGAFLGDIDKSLGIDYVAPNIIERFLFEDGTSLDFGQISERVIAGAKTDGEDAIYGMLQANTLDGGAGDDLLVGREGGDTYIFGRGYGLDVIEDEDLSVKLFGAPDDRLQFSDDLRWTDFDYIREGSSDTLTMLVSGTDEGVVFKDNLRTGIFQGFINLIEEIEFGDGTVWNYTKLLQTYVDQAKTVGDDTVYGFLTADTLDGGAGDDRLEGFGGADTYIYGLDYGSDVVADTGSGDGTQVIQDTVFEDVDSAEFANTLIDRLNSTGDTLVMRDIAFADVTVSRSGLDLIFTVDATGETLTLEGQYLRANAQGHAVESFVFTDRVVQFDELNPDDVDRMGTNANETLDGSNFAETLDGRGGDDILIGASDGDTYLFDVGYGADTIIDTQVQASWAGRKGKEIETEDRVLFGDDVTIDNAVFTKDGLDLVISIVDRTDTLRIKNQFRDTTDGVELFQFQSGQIITISDVEERLQIEGGNRGDNVIVGSPDQPNVLDGRQGDDRLTGGAAADDYAFGIGYDFDTIIERPDAAGVIDKVIFGAGVRVQNLILRRQGDDLLIDLGNGQDVLTIVGGLSSTTIEQFWFADGQILGIEALRDQMLLGTPGADQIIAFDGRDDVLNGGAGSDAMIGGTGDDTYRFGYGDGQDSVQDSGGFDRIEFGAGLTRGKVAFRDVDGDLLITLSETGDTLVVLGGAVLSPTAGLVETFVFADGETITLNDVRQTIFLSAPNGSSDYVEAGRFDPGYLVAPGPGYDTVIMAEGTQFQFGPGDGIDRVVMPVDATGSRIIFDDYGSTDAVVQRVHPTSTDLLITFPQTGDLVRLVSGLTKTSLPEISFADGVVWDRAGLLGALVEGQATPTADVITGTDLSDTIEAGRGDDDVEGGMGDDVYVFSRGDGADIFSDGGGADTLRILGYASTETFVSRPVQGRDEVVLTFAGSADSLTLRYDGLTGIDKVTFTDGTAWSRAELFAMSIGQGTDFDDVIVGSELADTIEGGRGNDDMNGAAGNDSYVVNLGDGSDIIRDYAATASGTDRLILRDLGPDQVSLRGTPDDTIILLPDGGSVRLVDQRDGNAASRIEEVEFADGTVWDQAQLNARLATDMLADGRIVGTGQTETFTHTRGDGSYIIDDFYTGFSAFTKTDRLTFTDTDSTDVTITREGDDYLLSLSNGEVIRLLNQASSDEWGTRYITFADGVTLERKQLNDLIVADQKAAGEAVVTGSGEQEDYYHTKGDGSYTIDDFFTGFSAYTKTDRLTFTDVASTEIAVDRDGDDYIITLDNGEELRLLNQSLSDEWGVRYLSFADGVTWERKQLNDAIVAGQKQAGAAVIVGGGEAEDYVHTKGDGSYSIEDLYTGFSAYTKTDRLTFTDVRSDEALISRDGYDILITLDNGEVIRLLNQSLNGDWGMRYVTFSDGVTLQTAGMVARSLEDGKRVGLVEGTSAAETFTHALGDGSYVLRGGNSTGDQLVFSDVPNTDVTAERTGDDAVLTLSNGETITLQDQFRTGTSLPIETLTFSDDVAWDDVRLISETQRAHKAAGAIVGGRGTDTFVHFQGDGSYTITDVDPDNSSDRLIFGDALAADVAASRSGDDLVLTVGTDMITVVGQLKANGFNAIETIVFADASTWSAAFVYDLVVPASEQIAPVVGTETGESYSYTLGDGTYLIRDYDRFANGGTDVLTFTDLHVADVSFIRGTSDNLLIAMPNGDVLTLENQFIDSGDYGFESIVFANGLTLSRAGIRNKSVADQKALGKLLVSGTELAEAYNYATGDGSYTVGDYDRFANGGADVLTLTDLNAGDVRFLQGASDDLVIVMADGARLVVANQFIESGDYGLERIVFADGEALDRSGVRNKSVADQKNAGEGVVDGTELSEAYAYSAGDGSYAIDDYDRFDNGGSDVLTLTDLTSDQVTFAPGGSDDLIVTMLDGARLTLVNQLLDANEYGVEQVVFADGETLNRPGIRDKSVADQKASGAAIIVGTELFESYAYAMGDGSYTIRDYDRFGNGGSDTLTLTDLNPVDITLTRGSGTDAVIMMPDGSRLTLEDQFRDDNEKGIESLVFADGTSLGRQQLRDRAVSDQVALGAAVVKGTELAENYVHTAGDGSYVISDYDRFANGGTDRLTFADATAADATFVRSAANDVTIVLANGETVRLSNQLLNKDYGIEQIVFADDVTMTRQQISDAATGVEDIVNGVNGTASPDALSGTSGRDVLTGGAGDDLLSAGQGDDVYRFGAGDGRDRVRDAGDGSDRIEISGYASSDARFGHNGRGGVDLIIDLGSSGDQIRVINGLTGTADRIETFVFDDGALTLDEVRARILDGEATPDADIITGNGLANTLTGDAGADLLSGGAGNDTYIYKAGDGDDRVSDRGTSDSADVVRLIDLDVSDIAFAVRAGPDSDDFVIRFNGGSDRLILENALSDAAIGVDRIVFADGTEWGVPEMRAVALATTETQRPDNTYGFDGADVFAGSAGDDLLMGREGGDTYTFAKGHGQDTVNDTATDMAVDVVNFVDFVSSETSVARLFKGSDTVVFSFASSSDTLTVVDALAPDGRGIESFSFTDGVTWTQADVLAALANTTPVAIDDGYYTATATEALIIQTQDLLRNDFDPDGDPLSIIAVNGGVNGTAELNASGEIVFVATAGFTGPTRMTYTLSDGRNGITEGAIDLRVRPLAEARNDDGFTVIEDGFMTIETDRLLSNDVAGDRMIVAQVLNPFNGSVSLASNGQISFAPDANFNGIASFAYVANTPEGGRAEATVYIDVTPRNDAPDAAPDGGFTTREDQPFQIAASQLLQNDSDIDGDALTITAVNGNGDVTVNLTSDGFVVVSPTPFFFGNTSFTYTVSDADGLSDTTTVSLYVEPVNNAPLPADDYFENDGLDRITEDRPVLIAVADLLQNDFEPDGDVLSVVSVGAAIGGEVRLVDNDTILFTPRANRNGDLSFAYVVDDGQGGQGTARATLNFAPENDAPIARNDSPNDTNFAYLRGFEDTAIEIPIADLLANDEDIEANGIQFVSASNALGGTIEVLTDRIIFTPIPDYWGEASFFYNVRDPEGLTDDARVQLYFENVGDAPPEANTDVVNVYEDVVTDIPFAVLLANDVDIDFDPLEIIGFSTRGQFLPPNGTIEAFYDEGFFRFTPDLNSVSSFGFNYILTDNADGTDVGFIDINMLAVNDDPFAAPDTTIAGAFDLPLVIRISDLLANDTDVDRNDVVRFLSLDSTSHGVGEVYGDEFIVVRFAPGFTGPVSLQYSIADLANATDEGFVTGAVLDSYGKVLSGGEMRDLLIGNDLDETINAGAGNDDIFAEDGADTIDGGTGDDLIAAGAGDDLILGGDGADIIDGGDGFDTVNLTGSNIGVRAGLATRIGQGGYAQGDIYTNVEALIGTQYADDLSGDDAANVLSGGAGSDMLGGGGGDDTLYGQAGDDLLQGDAGADLLDGGAGSDTASYADSVEAVEIDLAAGTAFGGDASGDTLEGIENLIGTEEDDALTGDAGENALFGGGGHDTLTGGDGNDLLVGGRGADVLVGGEGVDTVDYGFSNDGVTINMIDGSAGGGDALGDTFFGIEIVQGSGQDDTIIGDNADNILRGGRGADSLDGGAGFDIADYSEADAAIAIDLDLGVGTAGEALGDTLANIELVRGSVFADDLRGSAGDDGFDGGFGDDTMAGAAGNDSYYFGFDSGADTVTELGAVTDIDRIVMRSPVLPKDVSIIRENDDLLIELERDDGFFIDTLRVTNHFGGAETGIEEIVFDDGTTWDRDRIDTLQRLGRFNAEDDVIRFHTEDRATTISSAELTANDAQDGVAALEIVAVGNGVNGTPTLLADGSVSFLGDPDFFGDAFFDYTVRDEFGRESTATVEVNIENVNDAPYAGNDGVFVGREDEVLTIDIAALLANDGDIDSTDLSIGNLQPLFNVDGEPLSAGPQYDLTNGKAAIRGTQIEFTPRPDHFGFAGFTYTLTDDQGLRTTAEVELLFTAVNDAPRSGFDTFTIRLDKANDILLTDLFANDFDPEGDPFTFEGIHDVVNGSLVEFADRISFTADTLGSASFQYDLIDAFGEAATITVELEVIPRNDPPRAGDDSGFETLEDQVLVIDPAVLLANDTDRTDDLDEVLVVSAVERFPQNGKVEIDADGQIVFTPRSDFNGNAGFEYTVADGNGGFDTAYVSILVIPSNDAPVVRDDLTYGFEDVPFTIVPGEIFGNDLDPEGDVLFIEALPRIGRVDEGYLYQRLDLTVSRDSDGDLLPDWVTFDRATQILSAEVPADFEGTLTIPLNATFQRWMNARAAITDVNTYVGGGGEGGTIAPDLRLDEFLNDWLGFDDAQTIVTYDLVVSQANAADLAAGIDVRQFFPEDDYHRQGHTTDFGLAAALDPLTTVEVTLADGTAAPAWLSFDLKTLTFTADWPTDVVDFIDLTVTLSVDQALIAAGYWETYEGPRIVSHSIDVTLGPDQANALATGGVAIGNDRAILDFKRSDVTVTAQTDNGRALPDWLEYDADLGQFVLTGIAPQPDAEPVTVRLTFTPDFPYNPTTPLRLPEDFHLAADGSYTLAFTFDPATGIDPAVNAMLVPDAFFAANGLMALPHFDPSQVTVTRENGSDLPDWLTFNAETLTLEGQPPREYVGAMPIRIDVPATQTQPAYAILHELPVDRGFLLETMPGLNIDFTAETISVATPEDFNGPIAIEYTANDGKDGISEDPAFVVVNILPQAETPDANPDAFTGQEDTPLTFTLAQMLANDVDDDGDHFHATAILPPLTGTLTVRPAQIAVDASPLFTIMDTGVFTAELTDGSPLPAWLSIDPATGNLSGDQPLDALGDLDVSVSYTQADATTTEVITLPLDGNAGVELSYQPAPGFSGEVTFGYVISDNKEGTGTGFVTLTIEPLNDRPIAVSDRFPVVEDTPLIITVAELLANDTDEDGDALVVTEVFGAQNGSVALEGETITFTPIANYDGPARFFYTITDGQGAFNTGRVDLDVESTNRAPLTGVDRRNGTEDTPITISIADLLANDSDPDGDPITLVSLSAEGSNGFAFETQNGAYQFSPAGDFNGETTWSYTVSDGRLTSTGAIVIDFAAVNDAPLARDDSGYVTAEDTTIAIAHDSLTANDTDVEGDSFFLVNAFDGVNGSVTYDAGFVYFTPRADYFGNAGFTYTVEDANGARSEGFVDLSVTPENDLPIAVTDTGYVLDEDTFIDIDPADLIANDYDPDGPGAVSFLRMVPTSGLSANGDGTFRYTPAADAFGSVTLQYAIDGGNGVEVFGTIAIDVLAVSDAPVAEDDSLSGVEDTVLSVLASDLTGNDRDADGQALVITSFANTLGLSVIQNAFGEIVITPNDDFFGAGRFDYTIEDTTGLSATARVEVVFAPINDAPLIGPVADLSGTEDTPFAATLDASLFTDADGDLLTIGVTLASGSPLPDWLIFDETIRTLTGNPPQDVNGTIDLTVSASDGFETVTRDVALAIAPVNDAPVATDDGFNAGTDTTITLFVSDILGNDGDVDGDALDLVSVIGGNGFTAEIDGDVISVVRDADLSGQIIVGYTVSDGTLTDDGSIAIDLVAANTAPVVGEIAPLHSDEDAAIDIALPEDVATDADGDPLTLSVARAGGAPMPTWLTFDSTARTLTGTPPADFNGTVALQLTASDGRLSQTRGFDLVIDPVNDAPSLSAPFSDRFVTEDTGFTVALQRNLVSDVDGDPLSFEVLRADGTALPDWVSFDEDAFALTGQPPADYFGTLQLRLFASDGEAQISDDFALIVTPVNDAPVLVTPLDDRSVDDAGVILATGQPFVVTTQTAAFTDVDGDPLGFSAELADGSPLPSWLNFDGVTFSGLAPKSAAGVTEIRLRVSDGQEDISDVFALILEERNTAPTANPDRFAIAVPEVAQIAVADLLINDSDPDGDALEIVGVTGSGNATVSLADGVISYFADTQFSGEDTFTYTLSDGTDTTTGVVTMDVENPYDDVIISEGDQADRLFGGRGADYISAGGGSDIVFGGEGDDVIDGGSGSDFILGGAGNDRIMGGDGRDLILGGLGRDTIDGGAGADTIFAGPGGSTITGGTGRDQIYAGREQDTFFFAEGDGRDTIYNFQTPQSGRRGFIPGDELRLSVDGIDSVEDLMAIASQRQGGVLFDFGDGDRIFLAGTQLAALDDDQFSFY